MWLKAINNAQYDIAAVQAELEKISKILDAIGLDKLSLQMDGLAYILGVSNKQIDHAINAHTTESLKQAQDASGALLRAIAAGSITAPKPAAENNTDITG